MYRGAAPWEQPLDFPTPRAGLEPATIRLTAASGPRLTPTRSDSFQERRDFVAFHARQQAPRLGDRWREFSDRTRTRRNSCERGDDTASACLLGGTTPPTVKFHHDAGDLVVRAI